MLPKVKYCGSIICMTDSKYCHACGRRDNTKTEGVFLSNEEYEALLTEITDREAQYQSTVDFHAELRVENAKLKQELAISKLAVADSEGYRKDAEAKMLDRIHALEDSLSLAKSRQLDDEFIHKLRLDARQEFFDTFMHKLLDFEGNLQTLEGLQAFGAEMQRFYKFQDDNAIGFMDEVRKYMCQMCNRQLGKYQVAVDVPELSMEKYCSYNCPLHMWCMIKTRYPYSNDYRPGPGCPQYKEG